LKTVSLGSRGTHDLSTLIHLFAGAWVTLNQRRASMIEGIKREVDK